MFTKKSADGFNTAMTGIHMKTLNHGDKTLMVEFRLDKGHSLPSHSHPHEQAGYLVSGCFELAIGSDRYRVEPGDSWNIPSGAEHSAEIMEDSVAVEVFSPVREEYLP